MPEEMNTVRYRSQLIYEATLPEDRAKLWDNRQMWEAVNVASGIDAIDKILKSGEKDKILEQLDAISGYDNSELEETVKN
jgi:phage xkdN-like protein